MRNEGFSGAMLPPKALGENAFLLLSSFWWLVGSWFVATEFQSPLPSSYNLLPCFSVSENPLLGLNTR